MLFNNKNRDIFSNNIFQSNKHSSNKSSLNSNNKGEKLANVDVVKLLNNSVNFSRKSVEVIREYKKYETMIRNVVVLCKMLILMNKMENKNTKIKTNVSTEAVSHCKKEKQTTKFFPPKFFMLE